MFDRNSSDILQLLTPSSIEVNVSDLGIVTTSGKIAWGRYAQITNNPEVCISLIRSTNKQTLTIVPTERWLPERCASGINYGYCLFWTDDCRP